LLVGSLAFAAVCWREDMMAGVKGRSGGHNKLTPAEHRMRGTFRPSRHGARAHAVGGRPEPAADLAGSALAEWNQVVARLETAGILSGTDDLVIAAYARLAATAERLQAEVDALPSTFTTTSTGRALQHPAVGMLKQYRLAQRAFLSELALTPRSRIAPPEPPDPEAAKWDKFFEEIE